MIIYYRFLLKVIDVSSPPAQQLHISFYVIKIVAFKINYKLTSIQHESPQWNVKQKFYHLSMSSTHGRNDIK